MLRTFLLCVLLLAPTTAFSQEYALVDIGNGNRFLCEVTQEWGNYLLRETRWGDLREVSFNKQVTRRARKIERLQNKLQLAAYYGAYNKVVKFERRIEKVTALLQDIKDCRDAEGKYAPGGGGNPGGGDDNDSPGLACQVVGDSNSAATVRIINGSICSVGDSPVVELVMYNSGGSEIGGCSGTVVAPRVVITAGHCVEDVASIKVRTGSGVISSKSIHIHPSYNTTNNFEKHDAGVVITQSDLPTRKVKILGAGNISAGETAIIGGYGLDENQNYGTLRAAPTNIDTYSSGSIKIVYSGGGQNGNTCSGDSGGPIFVKRGSDWVLAGATSWGINQNCGPGDHSYFMDITHTSVRSFINSVAPGLID